MKKTTINLIKSSVLLAFILFVNTVFSQMSYEEYKAMYKPNYQKITPNAKLVTTVNDTDIPTGAAVIQLLLEKLEKNSSDEDSKLNIVAIITSCNRDVVAKILAHLPPKDAVQALLWVKETWIREVVWFVDKETYHNIAPHLSALKNWKGNEGPFGPEIKKWGPIYAGIAFDRAWGQYKGVNEYIDQYNNTPNKIDPRDMSIIPLDNPLNTMGKTNGLGLFGAFYTKKKNYLELHFQTRSATSTGGGESPEWYRTYRFSSNTFGIVFLKPNKNAKTNFQVVSGWGIHGQSGGVKTKSSLSTEKWDKLGSDYSIGGSYNLGFMINPLKDIPLMFGVRTYAQVNLMAYDVSYLESKNPQGTNGDMKSLMNTYGFQVQAIYKFGGKKDNKSYRTFNDELVEDMDKSLNTKYSEINPKVSPDGKTLYFIRADHPRNTKGALNSQDIWMADISNGVGTATASHLGAPFNTETYNSVAGVSPDENSMMIKGNFKNGKFVGRGYSLIYRTATGWSDPVGLDIKDYENMAKGKYVGAYWSQDGKSLLLSMSEKSTDDNQDIYVSQLQADGSWSRPMNLGKTINTTGDEHSPFLASDGKTLYFSSNREGGLGSNDIWMSKRLDDTWTNWSKPENLGSDVNTSDWDAYYSIDASGKYAYMASSKNSKGREDIVRIKLKEEVQPDPVVLVKGKVLNAKTNEPISATIAYNGLVDGVNYGVARTNPSTGEYKIVLPYGKNYDFSANAPSFIGVSENLDLTGVGGYREIERILYLVPIEVGSTVRLNNIFFETGSSTLKEESFAELNRVVEFMKNNPTVKIELGGHTDNVGTDAINNKLSQDRVNSVQKYLTEKGVSADRMVAKGYGKTKPVASNDTDEGRQQNRRVEFIILEK
jgi:OmpA-OmpF porin, OOP family